MRILPLLYVAAAAFAVAGDQPSPILVTKENAWTFYKSFPRLTKNPHRVAPLTAVLCAGPSPASIEREKKATGPHHHVLVHLYANALAAEIIHQRKEAFPEGAVIVKEKLADDGSAEGVGGMIKRGPGYDPEHGDWEYFYTDMGAEFSSGKLENCRECHTDARATDYVFSVWKALR